MAKHIVITGAAGAIGSALAKTFRREYPSAKMTLVDINQVALEPLAATLNAAWKLWDLSLTETLEGSWSELTRELGEVDVLINCAGIMEIKSLTKTGWSLGSKLLSINLTSPMRLMDLALAQMPEGGAVINISSMAGKVPIRGCAYYGAAKSGFAMASEIAHLEMKPKKIHVMTVYPGPVYSALESHARSQVNAGFIANYIPTGQPHEIAAKILAGYLQKKTRVIYPGFYQLAHTFLGFAGWFTSRFSPTPNE